MHHRTDESAPGRVSEVTETIASQLAADLGQMRCVKTAKGEA